MRAASSAPPLTSPARGKPAFTRLQSPPPLPALVHPRSPVPGGKSGTGFFVAEDGSLLTAAHVVTGCSRVQILSSLVPLLPAAVVARDMAHDVALLRVPQMHPPAVLPLARKPLPNHPLLVLGYPASAGPTNAAEAVASLQNQKLPSYVGSMADPREVVWIQSAPVTHGYSGGPIVDTRSGAVVGLVKAMVEGDFLRRIDGMPANGMAIGPSTTRLKSFLQREAPQLDRMPDNGTREDATTTARRATVHVLCWP
ncbi:MAG: trypsin-like peptidase domain-containing protein [Acetobacteraceae bacterium]|nr:trypsin-like peptidase domain-containing protein [Acetobacteraceae bacterium]